MSSRFLAPDLTQLTPADLIETISAEAILDAQKAWVLARWEEVRISRPDLPPLDTLGLETEPLTILLEAFAYRETLLRALVNDKARAVLLAYATGHDLEHLGAHFGIVRMVMVPGDPPVMESDDRLRRRIQLAPEAFSVAGPRGAYIFHALTLDPSIADAWAYTRREGEVVVVVAGVGGSDVSDDVMRRLANRFEQEDTVPLTDAVMVRRAVRVDYSIVGSLIIPRGPDPDLIRSRAVTALTAYSDSRCRIAATVFRSGIYAAGMVGGADSFVLVSPLGDVAAEDPQIPHLTNAMISYAVSD